MNMWHSLGNTVGRTYSNLSRHSLPVYHDNYNEWDEINVSQETPSSLLHADRLAQAPEGCKTVYVGKCRRRYFINAEYMKHPLLREIIAKRWKDGFSVDCEVVLFEHLVWMLENGEPEVIHSESSLKELAKYYASK